MVKRLYRAISADAWERVIVKDADKTPAGCFPSFQQALDAYTANAEKVAKKAAKSETGGAGGGADTLPGGADTLPGGADTLPGGGTDTPPAI